MRIGLCYERFPRSGLAVRRGQRINTMNSRVSGSGHGNAHPRGGNGTERRSLEQASNCTIKLAGHAHL
jgi:hypothetical protein